MADADLLLRPAHELAAAVREGELAASELCDLALARIDDLGERLGAFVEVDAEGARAAARQIGAGDPRPFAGVPIAIKDNRAVAGLRLTYGSAFLRDLRPSYDHNVVRRLRGAGFVVVGTTRMPEWGILPVTEPRSGGPARNPWDLERTPGGSSGGAGAAVAAGILPLAHGNDGGGSLRIPAACCGLVGLKPQRGRISQAPEAGESFLSQDGVLTRTVADTAAVLDVLAGPELGDASWAPPPPEPFARAAARDPGRLRVALSLRPPLADAPLHPAHELAARDAAALLEELGHDVEETEPPLPPSGLFELFTTQFAPLVCLQMAAAGLLAGREPAEEDVEPLSWALWRLSKELDAISYAAARTRLEAVARAAVTWAARFDAVLTPALAEPPVPLGTIDPAAPEPLHAFARSGQFTPYTALANVTGSPAVALPLGEHEGLPVGVQLIGQPAGEGPLLALAAQLEAARPWAERRPALVAGREGRTVR
jgi:amidase